MSPIATDGTIGELLALALAIPTLAVLIASLIEAIGQPFDWRERFGKLGWDCCVLALGAEGGILAHPSILRGVGSAVGLVIVQAFSFLLTFGLAVVIVLLRRNASPKLTGRRGLGILALGGAALAIPTFLALKYWRNV